MEARALRAIAEYRLVTAGVATYADLGYSGEYKFHEYLVIAAEIAEAERERERQR